MASKKEAKQEVIKITKPVLMAAAKELNGMLEKEDQISLKLTIEPLKEEIIEVAKILEEEDRADMTPTTIAVCNALFPPVDNTLEEEVEEEEVEEEEEKPKKGKGKGKGKDKKPQTTPTKKQPKRERSAFGHYSGSQAGNIDDFVIASKKEFSNEDAAKKLGLKASRVKSHMAHLMSLNVEGLKKSKDGQWKYKATK